jgi:predicted dehydrogenase
MHGHATKLSVYRKSSDYEVVGIAEPDSQSKASAQKHPAFVDLQWLSIDQLLNIPDLDVVLVETQVKDSLDIALRCVQAGKHIHLDKPAGESLEQFERILRIAQDKQLVVQLGYMYRYNPAWLMLKELHSKGWLGEIFEVHAVMSKVISEPDRLELSRYSGGTMFELGCHLIDLVVDLLGPPGKVTGFGLHSGSQRDSLRDNMLAVLEYPKATASIKSSAIEVEGFARRHLCVCGTEGTVHIQPLDSPKVQLAFSKPRDKYTREYQEVTFPIPFERYVADAADMAAILRGEKSNRFSYAHDLTVQKTILEACK